MLNVLGAEIPQGPAWAVAIVLMSTLMLLVVREILKHRANTGEHRMTGSFTKIEAAFGERLAALETAVSSLNGNSGRDLADRLARIEVALDANTEEIVRFRDWKHNEAQRDLQNLKLRVGLLEEVK